MIRKSFITGWLLLISLILADSNYLWGESAPDFSLPDLNGKTVKLSNFSDKVVLINFWASWCPPCRREIPHLVELYKTHSPKGLVILGVDINENLNVVKDFVKANDMSYTILMDRGDVARLYKVEGIPTNYIVNKGEIVRKYVGFGTKEMFEATIVTTLKPLLESLSVESKGKMPAVWGNIKIKY